MNTPTVAVSPGTGRLARRQDALLFDATGSNEKLVAIFEGASSDTIAIAEAKKLVVSEAFELGAFAIVGWRDGLGLLVFGDLELHSSAPSAPMISGSGSSTWVEHHVDADVEQPVTVSCGAEIDGSTDLRLGVVPSSGFLLTFTGEGAGASSSAPMSPPISDRAAVPASFPPPEEPVISSDLSELDEGETQAEPIGSVVPSTAKVEVVEADDEPVVLEPLDDAPPAPDLASFDNEIIDASAAPDVVPPPSPVFAPEAEEPVDQPPPPVFASVDEEPVDQPPPPVFASVDEEVASQPPPPVFAPVDEAPASPPPPPVFMPEAEDPASPPPPPPSAMAVGAVAPLIVDAASPFDLDDGDTSDDLPIASPPPPPPIGTPDKLGFDDLFEAPGDAAPALEDPPTIPEPAHDEPDPFEDSPTSPEPLAVDPFEAEDVPAVGLVESAICERGHANPPRSASCFTCGAAIGTDPDWSLIEQPVVGHLLFADGASVPVDRRIVIGRKPASADVQTKNVTLDHPEVSRTHAELSVEGWAVLLTDNGSRNGTYVCLPGDSAPVRLDTGVKHYLESGTTVHLGSAEISFTYEVDSEAPE